MWMWIRVSPFVWFFGIFHQIAFYQIVLSKLSIYLFLILPQLYFFLQNVENVLLKLNTAFYNVFNHSCHKHAETGTGYDRSNLWKHSVNRLWVLLACSCPDAISFNIDPAAHKESVICMIQTWPVACSQCWPTSHHTVQASGGGGEFQFSTCSCLPPVATFTGSGQKGYLMPNVQTIRTRGKWCESVERHVFVLPSIVLYLVQTLYNRHLLRDEMPSYK